MNEFYSKTPKRNNFDEKMKKETEKLNEKRDQILKKRIENIKKTRKKYGKI